MTNEGSGPASADAASSATPARRRQVVEDLCEAFAQDRLDLPELERRLDEAARARSERQLGRLLEGLPPALSTPGREAAPTNALTARGSTDPGPPSRAGHVSAAAGEAPASRGVATVDPSRVPESMFTLAFWSGRARKESWIPPKRIRAVAIQGGVELDFRDALWGTSVVELRVFAIMGGVQILVPPGINVETSGFAFMGGFDDEGASQAASEGAPTLRISGMALMGGVEIAVRLPGESGREARQRKRQERRDARSRGLYSDRIEDG